MFSISDCKCGEFRKGKQVRILYCPATVIGFLCQNATGPGAWEGGTEYGHKSGSLLAVCK